MAKFLVTIYPSECLSIEVEAKNEKEARELASKQAMTDVEFEIIDCTNLDEINDEDC